MGSSPIRVAILIPFASVAQLVEQRTENPRVDGSIPSGGTKFKVFGFLSVFKFVYKIGIFYFVYVSLCNFSCVLIRWLYCDL